MAALMSFSAEEEARLARLNHGKIVEAVAGGDGLIAHGLEGPDGGELRLLASEAEVRDLAAGGDHQLVAEQRRPAELLHQGLGKLGAGVAQNDGLGDGSELIQKLLRARQGVDGGDHVLDLLEAEAVFLQNAETPAHELVVIGFIACGAAKLGDAACLRKGDPDLGDQYALQIKACDIHTLSLSFPVLYYPYLT